MNQIERKTARKLGKTIVKTSTAYDDKGRPEVVYEAYSDGSAGFHIYGSLRDYLTKRARKHKVSFKKLVMQILLKGLEERKAAIAARKAVAA